jgi:hypothetical protein
VVSFTLLPLLKRGKSPPYPLDRRSGGPQSRSERLGEEKVIQKEKIITKYIFSFIIIYLCCNLTAQRPITK